MIKAVIYKKQETLVGFSVEGHAGYAKKGNDIICAAVSILVMNTVNAIEKFSNSEILTEQGDSGLIKFKFVSNPDEIGEVLIRTLELGLLNISKQYGKKFLQVHYKEV